jgi:hypothetical protein
MVAFFDTQWSYDFGGDVNAKRGKTTYKLQD